MNNICMGGVGPVYDEHDIPISKFLVDSTWLELANDKWLLVVMSGRTCMSQLYIFRLNEMNMKG